MPLILSTSWNAFRHENGGQMLFEISGLGFKQVELSFNLTEGMVEEVRRSLSENGLKVESIHNYCPIPEGLTRKEALPDCFSIASMDGAQRKLAVKFTKRSMDAAVSLGAKALVLHCGRVEVADRMRDLIVLHDSGKKDTFEFKSLRDDMIREREKLSRPFFDNTLESLAELSTYAKAKNIIIGIETRFYHREIPSIEEIGVILDKFPGLPVSYWHDNGHAQVMENLGFAKPGEFLRLYSKGLSGMHIHDVLSCQDHLAPGKGKFDFTLLKPFIKKDIFKVIEAHNTATAQDLINAQARLEKIFNA